MLKANKKIHILHVEVKNTSCMDYTLPLIWKLRSDYPGVDVSVMYCFADKKQVLRHSNYFSDIYKYLSVEEYDLSSFFKPQYKWLEKKWRKLFSKSYSDIFGLSLVNSLKWIRSNHRKRDKRGNAKTAQNLLLLLGGFFRKKLESSTTKFVIDLPNIFPSLQPDLVLLSNHTKTDFQGREYLYEYLEKRKIPVVLLPHAPHNIDAVEDFIAFDEKGHSMTDYCDYWEAFLYETHWKKECISRVEQFPTIGYPGLDSSWLSWMMAHNKDGLPRAKRPVGNDRMLDIVFIARKFLPEGYFRPKDFDPFTLDYNDFLKYLGYIADALDKINQPARIIVKPHPSNSYPMVKEIFSRSKIKEWAISAEPFYEVLPKSDLVISLFSTSLLIPAMAGIPTILINSDLQDYVHRWDKLEHMYSNLTFFVKDISFLSRHLQDALELIRLDKNKSYQSQIPNSDIAHLRQFYEDNSIEKAIKRVDYLLKK